MSKQQIKERAQQRLLAAELAEVLQVDVAKIEAADNVSEPRHKQWLAAAFLCLGVAVASGVAWMRTEDVHQAVQGAFDPVDPWWAAEPPFRVPMVVVTSPEQVAELPATTQRITVDTQKAEDGTIDSVLRRDGLRQLLLVGSKPAPLPIPWAELAACDSLRSLGFVAMPVQAQQLRQLRQLPELRALSLANESIKIDRAAVAALSELQALRHLDLSYDEVDPAAIARLAELPALTSLLLGTARSGPGDVTAQLASVAQIRTLRALFFAGDFEPMPAEALQTLRGLPNLIALQLTNCSLDDDGLAALPRTLQHLQLPALDPITPTGIASLVELGALRSLGFHIGIPKEHDAAVCELVQKLPIECFECLSFAPSERLWSVLSGLPLLRRLRVQIGDEDPRAMCAHVLACPKLEVLFVSVPNMPSPEQLGVLRKHATLRRIVLRRDQAMTPMPTATEFAALQSSVRAEIEIQ